MKKEILIATLGSEAQVVTLAWELLCQQYGRVDEVVVVHSSAEQMMIQSAITRLRDAQTMLGNVVLRLVEIVDGEGVAIADIENEGGAKATLDQLFRVVKGAKGMGARVHLCIAGGRKVMAVYGMVVAQLLFDDEDRLWHLLSVGALLQEKRMFLREGDTVKLVPIPVIRPIQIPPDLSGLASANTAEEAMALVKVRDLHTKQAFIDEVLTKMECKTLFCMWTYRTEGYEGWGERLGVTLSTVKTHIDHLYSKAKSYFGVKKMSTHILFDLLDGAISQEKS